MAMPCHFMQGSSFSGVGPCVQLGKQNWSRKRCQKKPRMKMRGFLVLHLLSLILEALGALLQHDKTDCWAWFA